MNDTEIYESNLLPFEIKNATVIRRDTDLRQHDLKEGGGLM